MTREQKSDERGPLRAVLDDARATGGFTMGDLTVLAIQNDPYRQDTPVGHAEGRWFVKHFNAALKTGGRPRLHLRGVHYYLVTAGRKKPNGKPYTNTDKDWEWLQNGPAKAARWLGYVPFDVITDNRADAPTIRDVVGITPPETYVSVGHIHIPNVDDIAPIAECAGFFGRQPFRLVIFGEKSSLADVVGPISARFQTDLFLETGEISDSHIHDMARAGAADGRPMRVFTLSDFDPAGYQMPVSIARKLQALRDLEFQELDFEVIPVALTIDQVRTLNLPSTPLKAKELRGDKWRAAWGHEQTEIDALATLQPTVLAQFLTDAISPFYDHTLARRVAEAEMEWREQAQAAIDDQVDAEELAKIRADIEGLQDEIEAIDDRLHTTTRGIELPVVEIPEAQVDPTRNGHQPLIASTWDWAEQTRRLKAWKAYQHDENEP